MEAYDSAAKRLDFTFGKGEVESSILSGSTSPKPRFLGKMLSCKGLETARGHRGGTRPVPEHPEISACDTRIHLPKDLQQQVSPAAVSAAKRLAISAIARPGAISRCFHGPRRGSRALVRLDRPDRGTAS